MRTIPNKSESGPAPSKPANTKPPDIASASVPDTLTAPSLFELSVLLAVDVGKSVSREGGKAQRAAYRAVAGDHHFQSKPEATPKSESPTEVKPKK